MIGWLLSKLRRRYRGTYIICGFHKTEEDPRGSIAISRRILNR